MKTYGVSANITGNDPRAMSGASGHGVAEMATSLVMLHATLESTTDAILVTDEANRVRQFNEKDIKLWGIPPHMMVSAHATELWDYISPQLKESASYLARVQEIVTSAMESFDVLELKDGRFVERNSAIQLVDQQSAGRVWCFRDITAQTCGGRARQAKRVLEKIASGAPLAKVLDVLVRGVEAQTCDGMICSVLVFDEDAQCLRAGAAPGLPEEYNRIIDGVRIGPRVGSCGSAAYKREPVFATILPAILTGPITSSWPQISGWVPAVRRQSSPATASYGYRRHVRIVARTNPVRMIGNSSAWRRIWQVS